MSSKDHETQKNVRVESEMSLKSHKLMIEIESREAELIVETPCKVPRGANVDRST